MDSERYLSAKPIAPHTQAAFDQLLSQLPTSTSSEPLSIVLDSGCGTGRSTFHLGRLFPDKIVVGVDKSLARLTCNRCYRQSAQQDSKQESNDNASFLLHQDNVFLVRAELVDFWRCLRNAAQAQLITIEDHYLLYPNPYPKLARLSNRWYAHASFRLLLDMSPRLVVRSNWYQFLQEFSRAVQVVDTAAAKAGATTKTTTTNTMSDSNKVINRFRASIIHGPTLLPSSSSSSSSSVNGDDLPLAWSNFEAKYHQAGEPTYELVIIRNFSDYKS